MVNKANRTFGCVLIPFFFLLLGTDALAQACTHPPLGMIAWWPMDETSGTVIHDVAGNHPGIPVNSPVVASGNLAGALRFNGIDNYVGVGDSDDWAFGTADFTVEFWANFTSPGGGTIGHPSHIFIGNDEGPGIVNKWFFALGGGVLEFVFTSPTFGDQFLTFAPFAPNLNQWYHLAVTRSGNVFTIYVDGAAMGSVVNEHSIPNANAPLTIGQAETLGFVNGLLDEIAVYNRALIQAELQAIVDAGMAGKCKRLSISPVTLSKTTLWPPNHDLVDVGLSFSFSDFVGPKPAASIAVTADEPAEEDTDEGRFSPDAEFIKNTAGNIVGLRLRAERKGNGDGRVYLIKVTATDRFGNSASNCGSVTVARDRSRASQSYVATQAAAAVAACVPLANNVLGPPPDGPAPVIGPKQ